MSSFSRMTPNRLTQLFLILLATLAVVGCSTGRGPGPQLYGERPPEQTGDEVIHSQTLDTTETVAEDASSVEVAVVEEPVSAPIEEVGEKKEERKNTFADALLGKVASNTTAADIQGGDEEVDEAIPVYLGGVVEGDSASAVDDQIWRLFDLAAEYHAMGVMANREASWEEAQYYFEKSLKIMADLDVETDTVSTPESVKYTTLLENVVADYRITLLSLGQLEGDVAPSVMVERFGDLKNRLEQDTLRVFKEEPKAITYDLPVKMNDRVKQSIIYFQTVASDAFRRYMSRSRKYLPLFERKLKEYGLPRDLIYLSLVESGYNPHAYSWARAMGLWQFISSTGRLYGLDRSWWYDERKDPEKATDAACRFLKDLYQEFGDWELAMAAYNGGPGRVRRTMKKQKTDDFWELRLKRQTMDYVPLIYAAAIIAKDPERYGFTDIEFEPPIQWETVTIDKCVELKVVAKEIGCSLDELKTLNPELLRNYTPPNDKKYKLKVPPGTKEKFWAAYDGMPSPKETSWVKHKINRGETVSTIAAKYGVSQYSIFEANNLSRRSRIYAGKTLIVPVPLDREYSDWQRSKKKDYSAENSVYTVRSGDTMWDIARAFGTTVNALRQSNSIRRGSRIYVGQKLRIPSSAKNLKQLSKSSSQTYAQAETSGGATGSGSEKSYKVRRGDTLWDIARQFGTTTSFLRSINGLGRSSRIYPGQMLKVSGDGGRNYVLHKVRRGETVGAIARKYRTTIARIAAANHLTDPNSIRIGDNLKIYVQ